MVRTLWAMTPPPTPRSLPALPWERQRASLGRRVSPRRRPARPARIAPAPTPARLLLRSALGRLHAGRGQHPFCPPLRERLARLGSRLEASLSRPPPRRTMPHAQRMLPTRRPRGVCGRRPCQHRVAAHTAPLDRLEPEDTPTCCGATRRAVAHERGRRRKQPPHVLWGRPAFAHQDAPRRLPPSPARPPAPWPPTSGHAVDRPRGAALPAPPHPAWRACPSPGQCRAAVARRSASAHRLARRVGAAPPCGAASAAEHAGGAPARPGVPASWSPARPPALCAAADCAPARHRGATGCRWGKGGGWPPPGRPGAVCAPGGPGAPGPRRPQGRAAEAVWPVGARGPSASGWCRRERARHRPDKTDATPRGPPRTARFAHHANPIHV